MLSPAPPAQERIDDILRRRLAAYKCPSAIHPLPASATGKILKAKLRGLVHE
ncbi:acyl-CoA synthetase (AMP-forming)/AMP-acid ligase II [Chromobacterium alkanivorans]|uniref:hypothetical protein n=1 Tax=Chromobacterium TaxID=535 RepID=UPI000B2A8266|nr:MULTISPECIES: hypothetical protein [Chromobacterium]MBN3002181.1 hypothetical protein [Chromobacterium alkanivorans]MCS3803381.1 acyl-CoA synthetase (AMP-forming)/AMP-acid ligase II [Chromobacterium alkanivorans]MCS3817509.1 acyl-CoA synthetase (AMP-forming)/AMP-acid ligase II [Chromobacterium alkanivorans]MCS3872747.1 acyl-CoA synthetase (AMP-forming)/AMP-acid ligase II [Chromobacterium alkanivorans]